MISLGVVDVIIILLFIAAIYMSYRRRGTAASLLIAVLLIFVLLERLAPGTLAKIGDAIHNIDAINNAGPHVTINPIIQIQK